MGWVILKSCLGFNVLFWLLFCWLGFGVLGFIVGEWKGEELSVDRGESKGEVGSRDCFCLYCK